MPRIFCNAPRFEPACMPASALTGNGDREDAGQQRKLKSREYPFLAGRSERQVGDAHDDRQRSQQEVQRHPAAIGVGKIGGYPVSPCKPAHRVGFHSIDEDCVLAGQCARVPQHGGRTAVCYGVRRLVGLPQFPESALPRVGAEQGLDPAISMHQRIASRAPTLALERFRPLDALAMPCMLVM